MPEVLNHLIDAFFSWPVFLAFVFYLVFKLLMAFAVTQAIK